MLVQIIVLDDLYEYIVFNKKFCKEDSLFYS